MVWGKANTVYFDSRMKVYSFYSIERRCQILTII